MNAVMVEHRRVELAKMILNATDDKIINQLFSYAQKLTKEVQTQPCRMTEKELNESIDKAVEEYNRGESVSHEDFLKKRAQWL